MSYSAKIYDCGNCKATATANKRRSLCERLITSTTVKREMTRKDLFHLLQLRVLGFGLFRCRDGLYCPDDAFSPLPLRGTKPFSMAAFIRPTPIPRPEGRWPRY